MEGKETPVVPHCSSSTSTEHEKRVQRRNERRFRSDRSSCVRCYNHGIVNQIKDQDHYCPFWACKCEKCIHYSKHRSTLSPESPLKMKRKRHKRHPEQEQKISGNIPMQVQSQVQKVSTEAGSVNKVSKGSDDQSIPKLFVSSRDASTLEDATNNFSFHQDPHALRLGLHDAMVYDSDFEDLEWERKLEAAEALITLRNSSRPPVDTKPANSKCSNVKKQEN